MELTFEKGQGGLGRPLPGEDHVSALLFFTGSLPSGFSSTDRVKKVFSPNDAEALGILGDSSDATAAVATFQVTTAGTTGDTVNFKVAEIPTYVNGVLTPKIVDLGTYTKVSGDNTAALVATAIAAIINAGTYIHGYSATVATATVSISFPKKLGVYPNTGSPLTVTISSGATLAGTTTQPSSATAGVASKQAVWRYHINEYFRMNPKGVLYLGFYAVPNTYNFQEITLMQNYAQGQIRNMGIFLNSECHAFASSDLTAINTEIVNNNDAIKRPLSALYAADVSGTTDLTTLTNLNNLSAPKVSAILGQDGAASGYYLFKAVGKSITCLGAALGAVSLASVNESIGWVGKFNISDGVEHDTPAFANGDLVKSKAQGYASTLNTMRYIYLMKYVGVSGSYFNDSHTAIVSSSDYAYIENNRVIDKAIRGINASTIPALGAPLVLNKNGTLTEETAQYYISISGVNLEEMKRNKELSEYQILIDRTQNVLSTNELDIVCEIVPVGVARKIKFKIGFVLKLSNNA